MSTHSAAAAILFAIRDDGPVSRAQVSRRTGLSQSVVSTVTRDLLAQGIISELGTRQEEMGRPSILLGINERHAHFIGFSITGAEARGVLTDLSGSVLGRLERPLEDPTPAGLVCLLRDMQGELLAGSAVGSDDLRGVGMALSGLIDSDRGVCIQSTVLGWREVPIADMLGRELGVPVAVENDADAVALGERLYGAAQRYDNFAVLSIGQGIGAGVFVAGRPHRGAQGVSGELGHCTVEPGGPLCRCGKRGCLEAIAAVPVLVEMARNCGRDVSDVADLETLAAEGDGQVATLLARAGAAVGLALSHIVNLFGPEAVIVTGSGTRLGPQLEAAIRLSYDENLLPLLPNPPVPQFRHEDGAVWARGAAGVAAQSYLRNGGG